VPDEKLPDYRVLTGPDTSEFCWRVSDELRKGYVLYGTPSCTFNSETGEIIIAQAIVRPQLAIK